MEYSFLLRAKGKFFLPFILLLVSGCVTFSDDGGFNAVNKITQAHIGKEVKPIHSQKDQEEINRRLAEILKNPLSVEDAVEVALINNKGLQAKYAELKIAEADLVEAGHILNPTLSFARLKRGDEIEVERLFMVPIFRLLTMSTNIKIETNRFEQAQLSTANEVLVLANDVRRNYFSAIGAQQAIQYMEQVKLSAEAGADLAKEMSKVGNWSKLQEAQEKLFYTEAITQLARAKQNFNPAQETLYRLLGLSKNNKLNLPDRLPDLPSSPIEIVDIENRALKERLDISIAQKRLSNLADSLGLTKVTGFVDLLDVGYQRNTWNVQPRQTGYEIELRVPIFDWGSAHVAKAEAIYMQSINQAAALSINAQSDVREAYFNYRNSFDVARHYRDDVIPLKKQISDELLLRYNGMLVSVFDLLADARSQTATVNASIEALRDYWIANSDLQMALIGSSTTQLGVANLPMGAAASDSIH